MNQNELMRKAQNIVAGRRQKALTFAHETEAAIFAAVPALEELQREKTLAGIKAARFAATGAEQALVDKALATVALLDGKREALLAQNGFSADALTPKFFCPVCHDTGRVNGCVCACIDVLIRQMRQEEINNTSPLSLCSFETFSLNKYPDIVVPALGVTARAHMGAIFTYCKAYAQNFEPHATSLYLCGFAGLGKTHLALSIAREVLGKGYDVIYASAQDAFDRMEKEKFSGGGTTMETMCSAELLILDDLGTEYISPYVSACLYNLVNTRVNRRLPTIYTSNIVDDKSLARRYTEKIVSRLLGNCEELTFCGEDIRLQNK